MDNQPRSWKPTLVPLSTPNRESEDLTQHGLKYRSFQLPATRLLWRACGSSHCYAQHVACKGHSQVHACMHTCISLSLYIYIYIEREKAIHTSLIENEWLMSRHIRTCIALCLALHDLQSCELHCSAQHGTTTRGMLSHTTTCLTPHTVTHTHTCMHACIATYVRTYIHTYVRTLGIYIQACLQTCKRTSNVIN